MNEPWFPGGRKPARPTAVEAGEGPERGIFASLRAARVAAAWVSAAMLRPAGFWDALCM
ncbi:MAG: hypothetical protein OXC98_10645 [bacterium]|nr:hypothetical protein [Acidimicrobiia bacterium]MCY4650807.1 hypothetical protein [bacterium]